MHSYVFRDLLKLSTIAAHACTCWHKLCFQLYTRPSWPRDARCIGGKMICFTREPEILSIFSTSSIAGTSLLIHSTDWSVTIFSIFFPHKFLNSLGLNLTKMLIWKENDIVKYGNFPDQSQSFRLFACSLAPKQTTYIRRHWTGLAADEAVNHLHQQSASDVSRTRINGSFCLLCKPRPE